MEPRYTLRSRPVTGSGSIARAAAAHGSTPTARMVVEQGHDDHGNNLNNEHTPVHTKRIDNVAPQPMNQGAPLSVLGTRRPTPRNGVPATRPLGSSTPHASPARPDNILLANKTPASSSGKTAHPRRKSLRAWLREREEGEAEDPTARPPPPSSVSDEFLAAILDRLDRVV